MLLLLLLLVREGKGRGVGISGTKDLFLNRFYAVLCYFQTVVTDAGCVSQCVFTVAVIRQFLRIFLQFQ